ncbi:MAG: biotin--[acetyl-CoA-carboxylase] ligase [Deltaproteobacteria bacterium]|nr:biotin--[acetyl-CoA-carboxylase] ligase [Deltaproteobacteria bacterium]
MNLVMDLRRYDTVPSTSDLLKTMANEGAAEWTAVMSSSQTRGRGRFGRHWHSPPGNIYLSVLLRPSILPIELPRLSLIAALAVFETVHREGTPLKLKWPNDILFDGRKLAGVLLEAKTQGENVEYVVVGIGINLKAPEGSLPEDLVGKTASLEELGGCLDVGRIIEGLEMNLRRYSISYRGTSWEDVRTRWREYADWDREYSAMSAGRRYVGRPVNLNPDGSLLFAASDGPVTLTSGELVEVGDRRPGHQKTMR